jgi:secondary thiamine-phosphate synthase enzyme
MAPSQLTVRTTARCELVEITQQVAAALPADADAAAVLVYVPHTTAGVCVQENADPDVQHDVLADLARLVPHRQPYYRHAEGNSDSHLKAILSGTSVTIPLADGRLSLGRWQGVYLCEFDGPRTRTVLVQPLG